MKPKLKRLIDLHLPEQGGLGTLHIRSIILTAYPDVEPDMDMSAAEDIFDYMSTFYKCVKSLIP